MLEIINITKRYQDKKVLDNVYLSLPDKGMIAIVGPSGCGKSTLLHIIGGLDNQFHGEIIYNKKKIKCLWLYRRKHISFIFQKLHLILWLDGKKNMFLPSFFKKQSMINKEINDSFILKQLKALSFGQRQKISFLRAVLFHKDIILCDEPTGSLDSQSAKELMESLKEYSTHTLVIIVSHDLSLVQNYCDEVYSMEDGIIISHELLNNPIKTVIKERSFKKYHRNLFELYYSFFKTHKKRMLQTIFGLIISLICILLTIILNQSLHQKIDDFILSMIPSSCISVKTSKPVSQSYIQHDSVIKEHMILTDYDLLGIGFSEERYQKSKTLFITDDSSPYIHVPLKYGDYPKQDNEIVLSLSCANALSASPNKLLNKKIYAWYKHNKKVFPIEYKVVGISSLKQSFYSIYQKDNAYIHLLNKKYKLHLSSSYLLLYLNSKDDREKVLKELKYRYSENEFILSGESTRTQIQNSLNEIEYVLFVFSFVAFISSLLLIGEVLYLNYLEKRKDYAIMNCFGCTFFHYLKFLCIESIFIIIISIIILSLFYYSFIQLFNYVMEQVLINNTITLFFDYKIMFYIIMICCVIMMFSQIIPLFSYSHYKTHDILKES